MENVINYFEKYSVTELLFLRDGFDFDYTNWATITFFDLVFKDIIIIKENNGLLYIEKGEKFNKYTFNYIENQIVFILNKSESMRFKVVDLISIIYDKPPDKYDLKQTLSNSKLYNLAKKNFLKKFFGYFLFRNTLENNSKIFKKNKKKFELYLKDEFSKSNLAINLWFKKLNGKSFLLSNCFIDFFICFSENEKNTHELFYVEQINNYKKKKITFDYRNSNSSNNASSCGSGCGSGCSGCGSGCGGCS